VSIVTIIAIQAPLVPEEIEQIKKIDVDSPSPALNESLFALRIKAVRLAQVKYAVKSPNRMEL